MFGYFCVKFNINNSKRTLNGFETLTLLAVNKRSMSSQLLSILHVDAGQERVNSPAVKVIGHENSKSNFDFKSWT